MLSPLLPTTTTITYGTTLKADYEEFASQMNDLGGKLLAIKSNAHSIEMLKKNPHINMASLYSKRTCGNKVPPKRSRGNGWFFQSSIEFIVERYGHSAETPLRPYNIRIFPATGTVQITGVQYPYQNARHELEYVLDYIKNTKKMTEDIIITNEKINLMNFKFEIVGEPSHFIRLHVLSDIITAIKTGAINDIPPPYPIAFVTNYYEAISAIFIKFRTPTERRQNRCTTIKIFNRRKINMLAAPAEDVSVNIYNYVNELISRYYNDIILVKETIKANNGPPPVELSYF